MGICVKSTVSKIETICFYQKMQIEGGYQAHGSDYGFVLKTFKNWGKNKIATQKIPFLTRAVCEVCCQWICVQNIKSISWKTAEFCNFNCQKYHFPGYFDIFPILYFVEFGPFINWSIFSGHCYVFGGKMTKNDVWHHQFPKFSV